MSGETIERARYRWREILPQLGVETRFLSNTHGPCPLCGGKDRYRFDDKDGAGRYYCNQCGAGNGVILLRQLRGWDFKTVCDEIDKIIGANARPRTPTVKAAHQGSNLARIERTLADATDRHVVDAFLRKRRLSVTSPVLCGHAACPYYDDNRRLVGRFPAVVAPILGADGSLESAALLYCADAPQPRKKFLPKVNTISGAAVRLFEPENGHLGIAEGIVTAMAVRQIFGVPTWAALSANGIRSWWLPEGVLKVTIYADHDRNHVGQAAAYDLAQRLSQKGIAANVQMPTAAGTDFADLLPEQEH